MLTVSDFIKRSHDESIYSWFCETMVRISRICKEGSFSGWRLTYLVTLRKILTVPRIKGWSDVLLIIRLLFTVPVSNDKLQRMLSKMKRVKSNFCRSIGVKRLGNILRIMEERSILQTDVLILVITKWGTDKVRRTIEEKGLHATSQS